MTDPRSPAASKVLRGTRVRWGESREPRAHFRTRWQSASRVRRIRARGPCDIIRHDKPRQNMRIQVDAPFSATAVHLRSWTTDHRQTASRRLFDSAADFCSAGSCFSSPFHKSSHLRRVHCGLPSGWAHRSAACSPSATATAFMSASAISFAGGKRFGSRETAIAVHHRPRNERFDFLRFWRTMAANRSQIFSCTIPLCFQFSLLF